MQLIMKQREVLHFWGCDCITSVDKIPLLPHGKKGRNLYFLSLRVYTPWAYFKTYPSSLKQKVKYNKDIDLIERGEVGTSKILVEFSFSLNF